MGKALLRMLTALLRKPRSTAAHTDSTAAHAHSIPYFRLLNTGTLQGSLGLHNNNVIVSASANDYEYSVALKTNYYR